MKHYKKAFEEWFNEYFCDQQGEDSPYRYEDIRQAFKNGFLLGINSMRKTK